MRFNTEGLFIKVSGITSEQDALFSIGLGASAVGFEFGPTPRRITPQEASDIVRRLPQGAISVGVFVNETAETIAKIALDAGLDVAQLHGTSEARGIRIWRAYQADESLSLLDQLVDEPVEALLIDTPSDELYGGTGRSFDWSLAKELSINTIIAGGLDADNVRAAIEQARPWGVDACSRIEKSPGLKDHEKMRKFIHASLTSH